MADEIDSILGTGAPAAAPAAAEDHDLDFLKPGFRRAKAAPAGDEIDSILGTAPAAPPPADWIGQSAADYQANLDALRSGHPGGTAPTPSEGDKVAPYGLSGLVAGQPGQGGAPQPEIGAGEAAARGTAQGATLGWADELAGLAHGLINTVANHELFDKNARLREYEAARDEERARNEAAHAQHPKLYTGSEIGGGLATALIPGTAIAEGAGALDVGLQGAAMGGVAAAGENKDPNKILRDIGTGAAVGGAGGAALHTLGTKVVAPLAKKALSAISEKASQAADSQAVRALARAEGKSGAPESLTRPMVQDPNISNAINEEIPVGAKGKTVTLAQVAGRPAAEVQPVLKTAQEKTEQGIAELGKKAEAKTGGATLKDLANHYDAETAAQPAYETKHINALQGAKQDALATFGPTEEAIEARKSDIGKETEKLYEASDKKAGGATLGDLVEHYNARIAEAKKVPGNEAIVNALEGARDSAVKAWGTKQVLDPKAIVEVEGKRVMAGPEIDKLEKMASSSPQAESQLRPRIDSIRNAASKEGIDLTTKVPAKDVRKYATHLQNEGVVNTTDPKIAARAKQFIGSTTKDFINGHVEKTLGPADRESLEALNQRTSALYSWPDVLSGKNTDTTVRDRVLNEFDTRIPHKDLDTFASRLEERGTQRIDKLQPGEIALAKENLGKSTRAFAGKTAAAGLEPGDQDRYERLIANRASQKNIEKILADRASREAQKKAGLGGALKHGAHLLGGGEIMRAIPRAIHGDYVGAAMDAGSGLAMMAAPHVLPVVSAAKRGLVRGTASAADFLANVVANADAGNPWAKRQVALLRQTPAGAARLAAAIAKVRGVAAPAPPPEAP